MVSTLVSTRQLSGPIPPRQAGPSIAATSSGPILGHPNSAHSDDSTSLLTSFLPSAFIPYRPPSKTLLKQGPGATPVFGKGMLEAVCTLGLTSHFTASPRRRTEAA